MDNVIKWVENDRETGGLNRVPATRLNQFEKDGYRVYQYDNEFFMIERIKSGKVVYCSSILTAEAITSIAITVEKKHEVCGCNQQSILDKAYTLLGKIDVMYTATGGDKVRRRCGNDRTGKV